MRSELTNVIVVISESIIELLSEFSICIESTSIFSVIVLDSEPSE